MKIEDKKLIKAAIYCRVSTRSQGDSGLSLSHQLDRCRQYCGAQGWNVVFEFSDVASAKDLDRPELQKLLVEANNGLFDVMVSLKLDRVSRVPRNFYTLFEKLSKLDVDLVSVEDKIDTTSAAGRMLLGIMLQFAAFEREVGIERTNAAMREIANKGLPGGGVTPLGYTRIKKENEIDEEGAKIIKRIYEEYIIGKSPSKIVNDLNAEGFRNKKHFHDDGTFFCGGKEFTMKILHQIITNPLYKGVLYFNGEFLQGKHDAIIEPVQWEKAQERVALNSNKKNLGNSKRDQHLLNGLMTCGDCGDIFSPSGGTSKSGRVHYYYKCRSKIHKNRKQSCNNGSLKARDLEDIVIDLIKKIATTDTFYGKVKSAIERSNSSEKIKDIKEKIQRTYGEESGVVKRQDNLIELISHGQIAKIKLINTTLSKLEKQKLSIVEYRESQKRELEQLTSSPNSPEMLRNLYKEFNGMWESLTQSDRIDIIKLLINDVKIDTPIGSQKGAITVTLYQKPLITSIKDITKGSRLLTIWLRRRDLNSRPGD